MRFRDLENEFKSWMISNGKEWSSLYNTSEEDRFDFLFSRTKHPSQPLVIKPTVRDILKIGPGAIVAIYIPSGGERFSSPLITKIDTVDIPYYTYNTVDGDGNMELSAPYIKWKYTQHPEHLWPDINMRFDGEYDSCNGSHICAIYDFGTPVPYPRNIMYFDAQKTFWEQVRIYRKTPVSDGYRNHRFYMGHRAWNHRQTMNDWRFLPEHISGSRGVYNGDIFDLAEAIISRRPMLHVPRPIDLLLFEKAFSRFGKPGYVGRFIDPWVVSRTNQFDDDVSELDFGFDESHFKPTETEQKYHEAKKRLKMRVNIKTFTKWVIRNYKRFIPSEKDYVAFRMEQCRQAEEDELELYAKDYKNSTLTDEFDDIENMPNQEESCTSINE